jgi:hypothetical protein
VVARAVVWLPTPTDAPMVGVANWRAVAVAVADGPAVAVAEGPAVADGPAGAGIVPGEVAVRAGSASAGVGLVAVRVETTVR